MSNVSTFGPQSPDAAVPYIIRVGRDEEGRRHGPRRPAWDGHLGGNLAVVVVERVAGLLLGANAAEALKGTRSTRP